MKIFYTVGHVERAGGRNNEDIYNLEWDEHGDMYIFENHARALNKAMEEARKYPNRDYFVMETTDHIKVPVGEPTTTKLKRGFKDMGV